MTRITISKAACAIVLGGALSAPEMARCETFPGPLLGKSVNVTWTANRLQRFESGGNVVSRALSVSLQIYISTAGRAFSKEAVSFSGIGGVVPGGRRLQSGAVQRDRAPDDGEAPRGVNVVHVDGRALVVDRQMVEGARRVSITFDPGYGSCNARVILARENGAGALRGRGHIGGRTFEVLSIEFSTPNCSVQPGNVFGEG
jgi:hypothetical protein